MAAFLHTLISTAAQNVSIWQMPSYHVLKGTRVCDAVHHGKSPTAPTASEARWLKSWHASVAPQPKSDTDTTLEMTFGCALERSNLWGRSCTYL